MRKPDICLCENKGADQLCSNCTADQRLCFRYTDSTFPPLRIPKLSRFYLSSVTVQTGLCQTWSEHPKTCFLASRVILSITGSVSQNTHYQPTSKCFLASNFLLTKSQRFCVTSNCLRERSYRLLTHPIWTRKTLSYCFVNSRLPCLVHFEDEK